MERLRLFAAEEEGRLLVLRDRVLEPLALLDPDVLELRDPGGEDVRVAMLRPYGEVTPAPWTTGACRASSTANPERHRPYQRGPTAP